VMDEATAAFHGWMHDRYRATGLTDG
jgi:hypothetical protein